VNGRREQPQGSQCWDLGRPPFAQSLLSGQAVSLAVEKMVRAALDDQANGALGRASRPIVCAADLL
jgi:hypothetical protein